MHNNKFKTINHKVLKKIKKHCYNRTQDDGQKSNACYQCDLDELKR